MLIYGLGSHAKVITDVLLEKGVAVTGIFDDASPAESPYGNLLLGQYDATIYPDERIVLTIGNNASRKKVAALIKHKPANVISEWARISHSVKMGDGVMVLQNVIVQADSNIGHHVILNTAAQIDHDCTIADFVHIAPGVILCGNIHIGEGTLVGAGAVVIPGIKIGKWCVIGAGSVVLNDVPDHARVAGNPARNIKTKE